VCKKQGFYKAKLLTAFFNSLAQNGFALAFSLLTALPESLQAS
jgi:hypothetical protein